MLEFPVLFLRQVFTNKDGSTGIFYLISNELDADKTTLETLFETREADQIFRNDAELKDNVILVSNWRPKCASVSSGTPSDWLVNTFCDVIEIHCDCSVSIASNRFINRVRQDESRSSTEIDEWLSEYAAHLPIGLGMCISLNSAWEEWLSYQINLENKTSCKGLDIYSIWIIFSY